MNVKIIFLLFTIKLINAINWHEHNWAMACDFKNNNYLSIKTAASTCGPTCVITDKCTHFAWTDFEGGTCWMKKGFITKNNAFESNTPSIVCGLMEEDSKFTLFIIIK